METIKFDLTKNGKKFKILNATNGGPLHKRGSDGKSGKSTYLNFKAAKIPYTRNHDAALCTAYGGPYAHDISRLFPNFDADPYDPNSYDFACTDNSILAWMEAGTEPFFRLGQSIEHQIKKHDIFPPKDFQKWAVICEQVIRHYNEGWADGYNLNIKYWEIWNEPDLDPGNSPTWGGTKEQFFDFYATAAKHLKSCFPHLKIGGPAVAFVMEWADEFLCEMQKRNVPIDFFSWHIYAVDPNKIVQRAKEYNKLLVKYNYETAESIIDEWNYVEGFTDKIVSSFRAIHGLKGSAYMLSAMCLAQKCDEIDMLMYYDTRPSPFNGAFDYYTAEPLKGYYPLYWYGKFYDMEKYIAAEEDANYIYTLCGVDANGKVLATVTYYNEANEAENKEVRLDFGKKGTYEIYLLDNEHNGELIATTDNLKFDMKLHSSILIKEI